MIAATAKRMVRVVHPARLELVKTLRQRFCNVGVPLLLRVALRCCQSLHENPGAPSEPPCILRSFLRISLPIGHEKLQEPAPCARNDQP